MLLKPSAVIQSDIGMVALIALFPRWSTPPISSTWGAHGVRTYSAYQACQQNTSEGLLRHGDRRISAVARLSPFRPAKARRAYLHDTSCRHARVPQGGQRQQRDPTARSWSRRPAARCRTGAGGQSGRRRNKWRGAVLPAPHESSGSVHQKIPGTVVPARSRDGNDQQKRIHDLFAPCFSESDERRNLTVVPHHVRVDDEERPAAEPLQGRGDPAAGLKQDFLARYRDAWPDTSGEMRFPPVPPASGH